MKIKHGAATLIVGLLILAAISMAGSFINRPYDNTVEVRTELKLEGYSVIKATTESPAIKIAVDSATELVNSAKKINVTTIYDTNEGFVVLDASEDIGYFFNTSPPVTWYGLPAPLIFVFFFPASIVLLYIVIKYEDD